MLTVYHFRSWLQVVSEVFGLIFHPSCYFSTQIHKSSDQLYMRTHLHPSPHVHISLSLTYHFQVSHLTVRSKMLQDFLNSYICAI